MALEVYYVQPGGVKTSANAECAVIAMILESAQEEVKSGKIESIESKIHGFVLNWKISYEKVD